MSGKYTIFSWSLQSSRMQFTHKSYRTLSSNLSLKVKNIVKSKLLRLRAYTWKDIFSRFRRWYTKTAYSSLVCRLFPLAVHHQLCDARNLGSRHSRSLRDLSAPVSFLLFYVLSRAIVVRDGRISQRLATSDDTSTRITFLVLRPDWLTIWFSPLTLRCLVVQFHDFA